MLHAAILQQTRRKVAQRRIHLRHGVGNGRAGRKHHPASSLLQQVTGFHEHVEGAVTIRVRQPRDTIHFGGVEQVLVEVRFIDENLVYAEFLEGDRVVFALAVSTLFELGG